MCLTKSAVVDITDHKPTLILSNNIKHKTIKTNNYLRNSKNFNPENFLKNLNNEYYNFKSENLSVNEQVNKFVDIF